MLPKFDLYMPTDFAEACRMKAEGMKVVAGGTDVYVNMHAGKDHSAQVLDIKQLKELQGQRYVTGQGLGLGALPAVSKSGMSSKNTIMLCFRDALR